jgi:hypothetical protein
LLLVLLLASGEMKKEAEVIRFTAQVSGIKTLIDGGFNVTLGLSKKDIKAITQLLQVKEQVGVILEVAAIPVKFSIQEINGKETKRRKQRYPYKAKS